MSDTTLSEILSGVTTPATRNDLHEALDELLDDADTNDGRLYAPAFYSFMSSLARGRGVAEELETAAIRMLFEYGLLTNDGIPADPQQLFHSWQWATLFHLLRRLSLFDDGPLPASFRHSVFMAAAVNGLLVKQHYPDFLGSKALDEQPEALARMAQLLLVWIVRNQAERDGISEAQARRLVLPPEGHPGIRGSGFERTWADWKKRAQLHLPSGGEHLFIPQEQINELWQVARSRGKGG